MDFRSITSSRTYKITDSPEQFWDKLDRFGINNPIFKRISAAHVRVRLPAIAKEPSRWTVFPYAELRARLHICIRDIATTDSTERFAIEVSVGKDGDTDWIFHRIEASPLELCDHIVEEIFAGLDGEYNSRTDTLPHQTPDNLNDLSPEPEPITDQTRSSGSDASQKNSQPGAHPSMPVRKLGKRLLRWTWNAAALTAIACAVVLLLPLNRLNSSQQVSPTAVSQSPTLPLPKGAGIATHGYVPPEQVRSIQVLGSFAGVAAHEGDTPAPGQTPSVPTFYLFSALNCQDCGAVENMIRAVAKTRRGYVMPVGFSALTDQNNGTAAALSQVYCTNPRHDAYLTWEQLRLYWTDKNVVAQCAGWDDMAKVSALAQLLIDAHVGPSPDNSRQPVLVAPNGAFHIGGFGALTTPADIAAWLDQNASPRAVSFSVPTTQQR